MTHRVAFKTPANYQPLQGNRVLVANLNFVGFTTLEEDFSPELRQGEIDMIQSAFFDNSLAAVNLTIQFLYGTKQKIVIPAGCQAYMPIWYPGAVKFSASSDSGVLIPTLWSNDKVQPCIWNVS